MAKTETSTSSDTRDLNQRSLGFVGLSAIAHVSVLIAVLLAPSFKSQSGGAIGAQAGTEVNYAGSEIADPSAPSATGETALSTKAPSEVLLADASDTNAVAMPSAPTTEPVVAKPEPKPVVETQPKIEAPVEAKPVVAKVKLAQPKPLAKAQPQIETSAASEVEIKAALEKARAEKVVESKPELPSDLPAELDAPEMPEEKVATQSEEKTEEKTEEPAKPEVAQVAEEKAAETPVAPEAETVNEEPAPQPVLVAQASTPLNKPSVAESELSAGKNSGTSSGTTSALSAPNANGSGTLGRSGGGDSTTFGSAGANTNAAPGVGAGSAIRDVSDLVAMPGNPKPTYPLQDKMSGKQGTTVLVGQVKADGTVSNVAVEKSSGSFQMDRSAAQAFSKWRFRPGQAGMIRSPFQFQLVGDAKEVPARLRTQ